MGVFNSREKNYLNRVSYDSTAVAIRICMKRIFDNSIMSLYCHVATIQENLQYLPLCPGDAYDYDYAMTTNLWLFVNKRF